MRGLEDDAVRAVGALGEQPKDAHFGGKADDRTSDTFALQFVDGREEIPRIARRERGDQADDFATSVTRHVTEFQSS